MIEEKRKKIIEAIREVEAKLSDRGAEDPIIPEYGEVLECLNSRGTIDFSYQDYKKIMDDLGYWEFLKLYQENPEMIKFFCAFSDMFPT